MIRVFTAFSGYDSQCLALNVLKQQYGHERANWNSGIVIDYHFLIKYNKLKSFEL